MKFTPESPMIKPVTDYSYSRFDDKSEMEKKTISSLILINVSKLVPIWWWI